MRIGRAVPTLSVALLLGLALASPGTRGARPARAAVPDCDLPVQSGGSISQIALGFGYGVTQPVGLDANVAACSLSLANSWSFGRFDMVQWDPVALVPDPTTVALRTRTYNPSDLSWNRTRTDFNPPVVVHQFGPLADPPHGVLAINLEGAYSINPMVQYYKMSDNPITPVAYQYPPGGARTEIPGEHAVLGHFLCGMNEDLQQLGLVQSVMTTDVLTGTAPYEVIQKFRVPQTVKLHWVELAFGPQTNYPNDPGTIGIIDGAGGGAPPVSLPVALVQADFRNDDPYLFGRPVWGSHYDFTQWITLQPGHDYWLLARTLHEYALELKTVTGAEGPAFTDGVGSMYRRTLAGDAWSLAPSQALCFRMVGEQVTTTGVRVDGPSRAAFAIAAAPNPFHESATLRWSGAAGAVWFEVLDPRGRRVASGEGAPGGRGEWTWRGSDDAGRALPAGVYFVRGTDDAGRAASVRVVRVR
jgi:hypothetical protein